MKKYLLILTFLLGGIATAFAQDGDELTKQERVKALYVAYVTQQLALTPDEAQKFWPLHTQFENELKAVKKDLPELEKQQARLDIKKKYQDGFSKIIGFNRCERLYGMGDAFRKKLLDSRAQKRGDNPQRQRPNIQRGQ